MQVKDMKSELIFHHIILVFHAAAHPAVCTSVRKISVKKNRGKYLEIIKVHV